MAIDIYSGSITLPTEVSSEILQKTQDESAIMALARQITLPGNGVTVPVITGDPTAAWVGETDEKPVSKGTLDTKIMRPYKLAVIEPFSKEFTRDYKALYDALVARIPLALAKQFDATVIGGIEKPGSDFDNLAACTQRNITTGAYNSLVGAKTDIAEHDGILNGFAISPTAHSILLLEKDLVGRPLFVDSVSEDGIPKVLGVPVYQSKGMRSDAAEPYYVKTADTDIVDGKTYYTLSGTTYSAVAEPAKANLGDYYEKITDKVVGVAGDWTKAVYGTVEGIQISVSDQATLSYINASNQPAVMNLWQRNMVAVMAEIEIGFRADTDCFNLLTASENPTPATLGIPAVAG